VGVWVRACFSPRRVAKLHEVLVWFPDFEIIQPKASKVIKLGESVNEKPVRYGAGFFVTSACLTKRETVRSSSIHPVSILYPSSIAQFHGASLAHRKPV
jgi:hypothetical protein